MFHFCWLLTSGFTICLECHENKKITSIISFMLIHDPQCCAWWQRAVPSPSMTCLIELLSALTCCTPSAQLSPKIWSVPVFVCDCTVSGCPSSSKHTFLTFCCRNLGSWLAGCLYVECFDPIIVSYIHVFSTEGKKYYMMINIAIIVNFLRYQTCLSTWFLHVKPSRRHMSVFIYVSTWIWFPSQ